MNKKPVCVKCKRGMAVSRVGVTVVELYHAGYYKVWPADVAKCPICGIEVTVGYPSKPILEAHHGQDKIQKHLDRLSPGSIILQPER